MARRIVYVMQDDSEQRFWIHSIEDEQHERAAAEQELRSRDTSVKDHYFENLGFSVPNEQVTIDTSLIVNKRHPHTGN